MDGWCLFARRTLSLFSSPRHAVKSQQCRAVVDMAKDASALSPGPSPKTRSMRAIIPPRSAISSVIPPPKADVIARMTSWGECRYDEPIAAETGGHQQQQQQRNSITYTTTTRKETNHKSRRRGWPIQPDPLGETPIGVGLHLSQLGGFDSDRVRLAGWRLFTGRGEQSSPSVSAKTPR